MLLADALESQLYPLELWPTYILIIIFAYDPQLPFSLTRLEKVIAFFFGNRFPLSMACQFFAACSGHPFPLTKKQFGYLYDLWLQPDRRPSFEYLPYYFDMRDRRLRRVDGFPCFPNINLSPEIGFEGTGFPIVISSILRRVNQTELMEDEED